MSATETVCASVRMPVQPRPRRRGKAIVAAVLGASSAFGVVSGCVPAPGGDVVALAAKQEGKPYHYGAAGPNAFDCSGLVQYVFRQAGSVEPRTAQQQYNASTHVSVLQAGRGDLVFYGAPRGVYHVGIYIGGGQMIVAPSTGRNVQQQRVWGAPAYGHPRG